MDSNAPIIDYSNPRLRAPLRLPSRTDLTIEPIPGGVRVVETIAGKASAVGAIGFAIFTMIVLAWNCWPGVAYCVQHGGTNRLPVFMLLVLAAEAIVLVLVIDQTWCTTTLSANAQAIEFRSASLLRRRRRSWRVAEIKEF